MPRIELLYWEGCPSWPRVIDDLREAVREHGLDPESVELREVTNESEAAAERFVGSPTIRIDGRDVDPTGGDEPYGLTCRLYRLRDGRPSPTPDPGDVRDALQQSIERGG